MAKQKLNPLIITATPNICWLKPDVPYPQTTPEIIGEAVRCREVGAAVLHTHAEKDWAGVINGVRDASDLIIQSGMSSIPLQERIELFEEKSDCVSIIANHHDEAFLELNCNVLHPLDELVEYAEACTKYGVKPEWEIWHTGSIWNLERLWNLKIGYTKADDVLPPRLTTEPIPFGPSKGEVSHVPEMLPTYYQLRGWDAAGVPTADKLAELSLV